MGRRPRRRSSVTCRSAGPERGPSPNGRDSCPLIIRSSWPMPRGSRRVCEKPDCRNDRQGGARPSRGKNSSSTCARGHEAANRRPIVRSDPRLGTRSRNAKRFRPRKNRLPAIACESPVRIREVAGQRCDVQQENSREHPTIPQHRRARLPDLGANGPSRGTSAGTLASSRGRAHRRAGRLDAALRSSGTNAAAGSTQEGVSFAGPKPDRNGP